MTKQIKKIEDLTPDAGNANKGSERGTRMIEDSLQQLGAGRSIVTDKNGVVIGGNKTLEAAVSIGLPIKTVPTDGNELVVVQRMDLDLKGKDGKARQLAYADNRSGQVSLDWDAEQLAADMAAGVDLGEFFEPFELDEMMAGTAGDDGARDDAPEAQIDRAAELNEKWQVERGQVWQIGEHRLMCGDSTSSADVALVAGDKSASMVLSDPPYGVDYSGQSDTMLYGGKRGKSRDNIAGDKDQPCAKEILADALRIWAADYCFIWYAPHAMPRAESALIAAGYDLHTVIAWVKNHANFGAMGACYKGQYEIALLGRKKEKLGWYGAANETTVWECARAAKNDLHPTQKPAELFCRAIKNHTTKGELICDPFLGSGTTMVAAQQLGRVCYGMEIEPKYCAVILERMADMGVTGVLIDG